MSRMISEYGPLSWNTKYSVELQRVTDYFMKCGLNNLKFSVTVADPSEPDCPLVACSIGFTSLTGYRVQEIVGRNCRFLLDAVPPHFIGEQTRRRCRAFCESAKKGIEYEGESDMLVHG